MLPFDWTPYGRKRWEVGAQNFIWKQDAFKNGVEEFMHPTFGKMTRIKRSKPFLTAADIVFLRDMKVGL